MVPIAKKLRLKIPLEIEDNSYEIIFCSHVLEHIYSPTKFLEELRRIIKSNGILILGLPVEGGLTSLRSNYFKNHIGHLYSFSKDNIERLLDYSKFEISNFYFEFPLIHKIRNKFIQLALHSLVPTCLAFKIARAYWVIAIPK